MENQRNRIVLIVTRNCSKCEKVYQAVIQELSRDDKQFNVSFMMTTLDNAEVTGKYGVTEAPSLLLVRDDKVVKCAKDLTAVEELLKEL